MEGKKFETGNQFYDWNEKRLGIYRIYIKEEVG